MAMVQVGFHLGRVVLLVGAGLTGSIVIRNGGRLSDFLNEVQEALREKGDHGADSITSQMQFQVDGLTREVRQLISNTPTVIHVDSGNRVISALIAPAAATGVLGYGYMWWKGISFSSIMYVTKQNMANAVSSMTKHLEQVQNSLAAAKRHLTQRIQNVDDRLDKQKEISGQIRDEVTGARLKLMEIGSEVKSLKMLTSNLDGRLDSIQDKQDCQLAGVTYLLQFIEPNDGRLPDHLVQYLEPNGAKLPGRLEGLQGPVVTRSGKQGELPGLEFGLRLLALEESANRGGGVGLVLSTPVNAAC